MEQCIVDLSMSELSGFADVNSGGGGEKRDDEQRP